MRVLVDRMLRLLHTRARTLAAAAHRHLLTDPPACCCRSVCWRVLQVPQSMAYASLAGMPAVWGLYGAFIPILMYSVFGSSRQLSVGPVAVTSLLIGNGVKKVVPGASFIDDPNNLDSFQVTVSWLSLRCSAHVRACAGACMCIGCSQGAAWQSCCRSHPAHGASCLRAVHPAILIACYQCTSSSSSDLRCGGALLSRTCPMPAQVQRRYNKTITQLAFLVAILYTLVGVLRLGFLLRFLSHPVTTGFTSGAAIIIGMSQVRYMLGMTVPRKDTLQEQIAVLVAQKKDYKPNEALMGMCMLIMILAFMQVSRRWPKLFWLRSLGPMTAAILGIIVVAIAQYNYLGACQVLCCMLQPCAWVSLCAGGRLQLTQPARADTLCCMCAHACSQGRPSRWCSTSPGACPR